MLESNPPRNSQRKLIKTMGAGGGSPCRSQFSNEKAPNIGLIDFLMPKKTHNVTSRADGRGAGVSRDCSNSTGGR